MDDPRPGESLGPEEGTDIAESVERLPSACRREGLSRRIIATMLIGLRFARPIEGPGLSLDILPDPGGLVPLLPLLLAPWPAPQNLVQS
jgi:hypothetical protein